ncbi:hypothetical protein ABZ517_08645 [Streptomyces scabiei]|uniref:hypothetical protein n=1 Tax=Streptomyces scabiei TaxID=1930 RepID=UPI0034088BC7
MEPGTVHRPTVTGAPRGVSPARVIKALRTHLKTEEPLADPSEEEPPEVSAFGWHAGRLDALRHPAGRSGRPGGGPGAVPGRFAGGAGGPGGGAAPLSWG